LLRDNPGDERKRKYNFHHDRQGPSTDSANFPLGDPPGEESKHSRDQSQDTADHEQHMSVHIGNKHNYPSFECMQGQKD